METLLVRLKPHDPRRGHKLRRFTYCGIKFQEERGWYRVDKDVADYLREVRQVHSDEHAPRAFDVCTADEAKALDAQEKETAVTRKSAADDIKLSPARGSVTSADLPDAPADAAKPKSSGARKTKRS